MKWENVGGRRMYPGGGLISNSVLPSRRSLAFTAGGNFCRGTVILFLWIDTERERVRREGIDVRMNSRASKLKGWTILLT